MPAVPRILRVVGEDISTIRSTRCSLLPAGYVIVCEFHAINFISSIMVFPGSGFFLSFPSSYGRPRGPASPSYLHQAVLQRRSSAPAPMSTRDARDTSRPFTLKISLRALSRAGLAGAIQLLPSQRNVALYDPMPAEPRALGDVGKGQLTFVQRHVTPFPQGQLFSWVSRN